MPDTPRRSRALTALRVIASAVALCLPAAAQAQSVHFTASGDFAMTANTDRGLRAIPGSGSQFHLAIGDFSYGKSGQEPKWCTYVQDRVGSTFPFELVSGNHESSGVNGSVMEFAKCLPNRLPGMVGRYGRQWYVDVPATNPVARIIMASPGLTFPDGKTTYAAGTPEYQWLSNTIDGARARNIRWVVAGMHYPCLSIGVYGCVMGRDTFNLLVSKRVDLVLTGHEHNYTRTFQVGYGSGCPSAAELRPTRYVAACVRDRDSAMRAGAGTVFAIVGTGGTTLRDLSSTDAERPYFAAMSGLNLSPSWGFLDVTATATALRAKFVPVAGTFHDAFSITTAAGADADADGTVDTTDLCPTRPGPATRRGCPLIFGGTAGADSIDASPWSDVIRGYGGNDALWGRAGNDAINGGPGADAISGGYGNDVLYGSFGRDTVFAGPGNDRIVSRDRERDVVSCGVGYDTVDADLVDVVSGCERVVRR